MVIKKKGKILHDGATKIIYQGPDPDNLILHFKDNISTISAKEGDKNTKISGKGVINNRISETIMLKLSELGIQNHFLQTINMREQLVQAADVVPIKVVVRNVAAGSICDRLGIDEGVVLPHSVVEFYLKNNDLKDPILNEDHIVGFMWADKFEVEEIKNSAIRVNDYLSGLFNGIGIRLIDFKLEFGRYVQNNLEQLIIIDEITPDTCRLWDMENNDILGKERFTKGLDSVLDGYMEIAKRLKITGLSKN